MIEAVQVSKRFGDIQAIDSVSATIREGSVFGLIGSNGAGKSTFMRMMAGVLRPDSGTLMLDGETMYENTDVKQRVFYISDDSYFFPNATPLEHGRFLSAVYPRFDLPRFRELTSLFGLSEKRRINTFSKGMKKQLCVISALASGADYLLCDETFDGLDPVVRQTVKGLFAAEMADRGATIVAASHNLRELEDLCDTVGLLHRGGILFERELDELKLGLHRVQCAFPTEKCREDFPELPILRFEKRGLLCTITARGDGEELLQAIRAQGPSFAELLPLTLEEIFIEETEVNGYDIKKLLF